MASSSKKEKKIKLKLNILKAVNLYDADFGINNHSDPYVVAKLRSACYGEVKSGKNWKKKIGTTKVIKNDLNPVWKDESFEFSVPHLDYVVHLEVWDRDTLSKDDYLGESHIELWNDVFEEGSEEEIWLQLGHRGKHARKLKKRKEQGSLKCSIECLSGLDEYLHDEVQVIGFPEQDQVKGFNDALENFLKENPEAKQQLEKVNSVLLATKSHNKLAKNKKDSKKDSKNRAPVLLANAAGLGKSSEWKSTADLPIEWTVRPSVDDDETNVPWVRIPRVRHRLKKEDKDGKVMWSSTQLLVGKKAQEICDADHDHHKDSNDTALTSTSTHDDDDASSSKKNPWETPKHPPKKSTYDWQNWGDTQFVKVRKFWNPIELMDIVKAIKDARKSGVTIRCVGHAHSWSPVFNDNGNDLMIMKGLRGVWKNFDGPIDTWTVSCLAGTSTGDLSNFLKKNGVFLPTNVISTKFIIGGLLSTGSHGSGWSSGLVLDYVVSMQIVDSDGKLRKYNKFDENGNEHPDWKYIALNLGLYGIMYSVTFKVEREVKHAKNIDYSIDMDEFWNTPLHQEVILSSHYVELFWFPFNKKMWVKVWDWTDEIPKTRPIKALWHTFTQWIQSRIGRHINPIITGKDNPWPFPKGFFHNLTPQYLKAAYALLEFQMLGTKNKPKVHISTVPDAIHWRKFLDAMPVFNTEFAINLPKTSSGGTDLSAAKDSWNLVVKTVDDVANGKLKIPGVENKYPMNVTLEARFGAGTCAVLGNNYGNHHTCWIEFVTGVWTEDWKYFSNYISSEWMKKYPSARSHWGKYQQDMPNWIERLRKSVGQDHIDAFLKTREKYNPDPDNVFTNSWLRAIFDLKRPGEKDSSSTASSSSSSSSSSK